MNTVKMTRTQMIEKLQQLHVGSRVQWQGSLYTVMSIIDQGGKLCRRDMSWLEDGKRDEYFVPGKYLAEGKMIECTDRIYRSLMAYPSHMDFEIIA